MVLKWRTTVEVLEEQLNFFIMLSASTLYCHLRGVFRSATYFFFFKFCKSYCRLPCSLSFPVKIWKRSSPLLPQSIHPLFWLRTGLTLISASGPFPRAPLFDGICGLPLQLLRYSYTQACGCIPTYICEHIQSIHTVYRPCLLEITFVYH